MENSKEIVKLTDEKSSKAEDIYDKIRYIRELSGCQEFDGDPKIFKTEHKKRLEKVLEKALDIRKFEIELYWKRTQYFWAFLVTIYGSYVLISTKSGISVSELDPVIRFVLAALGMCVCLGWNQANRGSKFWQDNWEHHVDVLEDYVYGPLYKIVISKTSHSIYSPTAPYPSSVSKINSLLSLLFTVAGSMLFLAECISYYNIGSTLIKVIIFAILIAWIVGYPFFARSEIAKIYEKNRKNVIQPVFLDRRDEN
jgi:hypothetical protein